VDSRIVIAAYRPKPGQAASLADLLLAHVPMLQDEGLATDREAVLMRASDGTVVEVFEWSYDGAADEARSNEAAAEMSGHLDRLADVVTLADLPEAGARFPHFKPI
jgi:hypothetical protein